MTSLCKNTRNKAVLASLDTDCSSYIFTILRLIKRWRVSRYANIRYFKGW